jgi:hypothetical protein
MNFDFLEECEVTDATLQKLYQSLSEKLKKAENLYHTNPQQSGIFLREAAELICRIYNAYYEIGFAADTSLEEFLCYTDSDAHNANVSRFLSAVRKEQRDRLNRLRTLGDDCIWGDAAPSQGMTLQDRMSQNARRMMETMMACLKVMCQSINGRTDLNELTFCDNILPGYIEPEDVPIRKGLLARILGLD